MCVIVQINPDCVFGVDSRDQTLCGIRAKMFVF